MNIDPLLLDKLETEYLRKLISALKQGILHTNEAKVMTADFVALLPFSSQREMEEKIKGFTQKYPIIGDLYTDLLRFEDRDTVAQQLTALRSQLQEFHNQPPPLPNLTSIQQTRKT